MPPTILLLLLSLALALPDRPLISRKKIKLAIHDTFHPYSNTLDQTKVIYQLANISNTTIQNLGKMKTKNQGALLKSKFLKNNNLPVKFEYLNYLSLFYYPNSISGSGFSNRGENMQLGQQHEFDEEEDLSPEEEQEEEQEQPEITPLAT